MFLHKELIFQTAPNSTLNANLIKTLNKHETWILILFEKVVLNTF
jgi:hypothetical protein